MGRSLKNLEDFGSPFNKGEKYDPDECRKTLHECINKIMGTSSFRKLAGKTQVILSINGPDIRTRLTHTMEVAKIARDLCRSMGLNAELAEAISLAHDIGHTPFGHVGERTLRDILCGCNTLDKKVPDDDFGNAGFKHNLQSFRVLVRDLGISRSNVVDIDPNGPDILWPYILWGVLIHTKMTYAKFGVGTLDDAVFISSHLCPRIYNCYFDESHECSRNRKIPRDKTTGEGNGKDKLCKPWYCAILRENEVGEISAEKVTVCLKRCYLAKLWNAKINNVEAFSNLDILFDHPFPNIFYASCLSNYFFHRTTNYMGWVSLESLIVRQADEIAQRKQDLEDAINKELISIDDAKREVKTLISPFSKEKEFKSLYVAISEASKSHKLGELLAQFYKKLLDKNTKKNVIYFVQDTKAADANIYILVDTIYKCFWRDSEEKKRAWIKEELRRIRDDKITVNARVANSSNKYFTLKHDHFHEGLFLIAYQWIEDGTKKNTILGEPVLNGAISTYDVEMLELLVETMEKENVSFAINRDMLNDKGYFLSVLSKLNAFIKRIDPPIFNLFHYYVLYSVYEHYNLFNDLRTVTVLDVIEFLKAHHVTYKQYEENRNEFFDTWKKLLNFEANRILTHLVDFIDVSKRNNKNQYARKQALKDFEDSQKGTVIHSEKVEKNDGKSDFILRRLFKAYLTNPHQLPDTALSWILSEIKIGYSHLVNSEKVTLAEKLGQLKPTLILSDSEKGEKIEELKRLAFEIKGQDRRDREKNVLEEGLSHEIKALWDEEMRLREFLEEIYDNNISYDNNEAGKLLKRFRKELDNAVLRAIPKWRSLLIRGICDHIAGMTDQEAISEYEKLYTGVMELV